MFYWGLYYLELVFEQLDTDVEILPERAKRHYHLNFLFVRLISNVWYYCRIYHAGEIKFWPVGLMFQFIIVFTYNLQVDKLAINMYDVMCANFQCCIRILCNLLGILYCTYQYASDDFCATKKIILSNKNIFRLFCNGA